MKKKKNKWCHFRHKVWFATLRPIFRLLCKIKYNFKGIPYKGPKNQNYIIISNHTCTLDPFFISLSLKEPIYYVASDDIFKNRFASKFMEHCVAPIPIRKGSIDLGCIKQCVSIAKEGGNIGLFPEGNRTFSGELGNIELSLVKFVRLLKLPLLIYYIDGGYGIDPRWGKGGRKSNGANGRVVKELSIEEIKSLKDDELLKIVVDNLSQAPSSNLKYRSKNNAEYLERVLFICPECHSFESISSNKDMVYCTCGLKLKYNENMTFSRENGPFSLKKVNDWMRFQKDYLKDYVVEDNKVLLSDNNVDLILVAKGKQKEKIDTGRLEMYSDHFSIVGKETHIFNFKDISNVVNQGKHKVLFYIGENYYQFNGEPRFSSYKYYLMYNRIQNTLDNTL